MSSRLYYPPETATPATLATTQATARAPGTPAAAAPAASGAASEFTQKMVKMVPAELVTAYTAAVAVISDVASDKARMIAYAITFVVCLVLTPVYLNNEAEPGRPKWTHIIISTLAFPVWAYLVSGNQIMPAYYNGSIALLATILFSVVTGAIPLKK
ncbi:hypothetical protein [Kordiimonas sp.]|uniref:hypothetical protein n=1 Tax=Kordiimonas sp. TaxID=1970157 RepID=UPI003A94C69D